MLSVSSSPVFAVSANESVVANNSAMIHPQHSLIPPDNNSSSNKKTPLDLLASLFRRRQKDSNPDSGLAEDSGSSSNHQPHYPSTNQQQRCLSEPTNRLTVGDSNFRKSAASPIPIQSPRMCPSPTCRSPSMYEQEVEALHMSRQDNPYIQQQLEQLSMQEEQMAQSSEYRLQSGHDQQSLVTSDELSSGLFDESNDLHQHLVRSPPPMFPQKISQFTFPSSPLHRSLLTNGSAGHHSSTNLPLSPCTQLRNSSGLLQNLRPKGSLPSLFLQDSSVPAPRDSSLKRPSKPDLNPMQSKSGGVAALDPGMRELLDFQKQNIQNNDIVVAPRKIISPPTSPPSCIIPGQTNPQSPSKWSTTSSNSNSNSSNSSMNSPPGVQLSNSLPRLDAGCQNLRTSAQNSSLPKDRS